jgi:hypothetical protein
MSEIAADFREFLHIRIENIERLRVLLLMHKEPVEWTVDALSSRLYIPPDKVLTELQSLRDQEFISESGRFFHYNPDTRHNRRVEELAQFDREKPVTLINLVYERPTGQLKKFADAFKLKKKDP